MNDTHTGYVVDSAVGKDNPGLEVLQGSNHLILCCLSRLESRGMVLEKTHLLESRGHLVES